MLNKEKYAKEIIAIAEKGDRIAVNNGIPTGCGINNCENCDFDKCNKHNNEDNCYTKRKKWFNEEYNTWNDVPVDTKILVSDNCVKWFKRHFSKCVNGVLYAFDDGKTSFTTDVVTSWKFAKLYNESEDK